MYHLKLLVLVLTSLVLGSCAAPVKNPGNEVYRYSEANTYYAIKETEIPEGYGLIILRVLLDDQNDIYDAVTARFTTNSIDVAKTGNWTDDEQLQGKIHQFLYAGSEGKYLAIVVKPGTYRYMDSFLNIKWLHSRYTPAYDISFTIEKNEIVYVGDLTVTLLHSDSFYAARGFQFSVSDNSEEARQFYSGLNLIKKPALITRLMSNTPIEGYKRYARQACDGLWSVFSSSRDRGNCTARLK